jgi:hypothetical protein
MTFAWKDKKREEKKPEKSEKTIEKMQNAMFGCHLKTDISALFCAL